MPKPGRTKSKPRQKVAEGNQAKQTDSARRSGSFWSGSIAFGLVSIPVSLYTATRSGGVSLRLVDADGTPLQRRYICSKDEAPVGPEEIVRGYEVERDGFVTLSDEELAALEPQKSREIDLKRFVPLDQIDPIYFERAYFLAPERDAAKAYRLLARTLQERRRAGIATFVMRGKEYLVAIIGEAGLLRAEILRFHDELRTPEEVGLPAAGPPPRGSITAIKNEMKTLAAERLDRDLLLDGQALRLRTVIERKLESGTDVYAAAEEPEPDEDEGAEVVDLMQVLKRSLTEAPRRAARPRTNTPTAPGKQRAGVPLAEQSRAQLYALAKGLNIPGRSGMTKDQLLEAVRGRG